MGRTSVNPHSLLSCNDAATNCQNHVEAVLQLQGRSGDRQVTGAELALAPFSVYIMCTHYDNALTAN